MSDESFTLEELQFKADNWYKLTATEQLKTIDWIEANIETSEQIKWSFGHHEWILWEKGEPYYHWEFEWELNHEHLRQLSPGQRKKVSEVISIATSGINEGGFFDNIKAIYRDDDDRDNWEKHAFELIKVANLFLTVPAGEEPVVLTVAWTPIKRYFPIKIEAVRILRVVKISRLK